MARANAHDSQIAAAQPGMEYQDATVSALVVQRLLDAVEATGISRAEIARTAARNGLRLEGPDARVHHREVERMCELALKLTGDPALALHWAQTLTERTFNPISHILSYARSLRQGLDLLSQYQQLLCDRPFYTLRERGHLAELCFFGGWTFSSPEASRFASEMTVAGFLVVLGLYGAPANIKEVRFAYPAPDYRHEYDLVFGQVIRFDRAFTGLVFERVLLDVPSPHWDDDLQGAMRAVADARLLRAARHAPYALRVREFVRQSMPERINMSLAARACGVSVRTLRRQLSAEGTSYRSEEYAALESVAENMLRDKQLSIQETAYAMGFSDAATFHRAFKQWTGTTPRAFRQRDRVSLSAGASSETKRGECD